MKEVASVNEEDLQRWRERYAPLTISSMPRSLRTQIQHVLAESGQTPRRRPLGILAIALSTVVLADLAFLAPGIRPGSLFAPLPHVLETAHGALRPYAPPRLAYGPPHGLPNRQAKGADAPLTRFTRSAKQVTTLASPELADGFLLWHHRFYRLTPIRTKRLGPPLNQGPSLSLYQLPGVPTGVGVAVRVGKGPAWQAHFAYPEQLRYHLRRYRIRVRALPALGLPLGRRGPISVYRIHGVSPKDAIGLLDGPIAPPVRADATEVSVK